MVDAFVVTGNAGVAVAARRFHALSDPTRLEIVRSLASGERCVCDLQDELEAAQSRLSFHLKTLKVAGLVTDRRAGRWVYYQLDPSVLESLAAFLNGAARAAADGAQQGRGCCVVASPDGSGCG
jgi:ArsR family transcriptional regulator, arsenate/arsenite/antimonite-responsive transcriptional repressor